MVNNWKKKKYDMCNVIIETGKEREEIFVKYLRSSVACIYNICRIIYNIRRMIIKKYNIFYFFLRTFVKNFKQH